MLKKSNEFGVKVNTSDWSLGKSGQLNDSQANWNLNVVKGDVSSNLLKANGYLSIQNTSQGYANVGNIVVNLQRKKGKDWVTVSSDLANATQLDDAASVKICSTASSENKSSFSKNAASGSLHFMDAGNNSLLSYYPQFYVAPSQIVSLLFSASFNNSILGIPPGESVRAEVIVTFGNAGARGGSGSSCQKVDINGNGAIDPKESYVRSVPARYTFTVPALIEHNKSVAVTDLVSQIGSTGTVSFSEFLTALGSGTGTESMTSAASRAMSVEVDGGMEGGLITNCGNVSSDDLMVSLAGPIDPATGLAATYSFACAEGVSQQACSSIEVPGIAPAPIPIRSGDFITYSQGGWGAKPAGNNPGTVLANHFSVVSPEGKVQVGASIGGYSMAFTSSAAVDAYLPGKGTPSKLTANLVNPTKSSAGVFGGQVLALELNLKFSDAGILPAGLGDLKFTGTGTSLDGVTLRQGLAAAHQALGGAALPEGYSYSDLNTLVTRVNEAFDNGSLSTWAQAHLMR